ncbi:hypothetical protein [Roseovarius indicus]|uniref:hypothetical protein n=1 Tax=Roseovarius indicus TaxID=540747 RepID=UPI0032EF768A
MTAELIVLDSHRTSERSTNANERRLAAMGIFLDDADQPHLKELVRQMRADPAPGWDMVLRFWPPSFVGYFPKEAVSNPQKAALNGLASVETDRLGHNEHRLWPPKPT